MSWRLMHSRAKTRWRRGGEPALRQLAPRSPWPGGGTAWGGAARQVAGDGPPRRPTRFALIPPEGDPGGCDPPVLEAGGA